MPNSDDRSSDAPSITGMRQQISELKVVVRSISQKSRDLSWNAIDHKITLLNSSSEVKQNCLERQLRNDILSHHIQSLLDRLED